MPFMNKALARLVQEEYPNYANDADDQVKYRRCVCCVFSGSRKHMQPTGARLFYKVQA